MDDRGTPINVCPMIGSEDIDLYRLFRAVYKLGGYNRVTNQNQWKAVTRRLGFTMQNSTPLYNLVKQAYKKVLHSFEDFYRKLGCTMVNHPRGSTRKQRPGRSLIRDKDRNTPIPPPAPVQVKSDKDEDDKKIGEDEKKEKKEVKKEQVKEEEIIKIKKKEESEGNGSGQESDINVEGDIESSSNNEKSQKPTTQISTSPTSCSTTSASSSRTKSKNKEDTKKKIIEKKKTETKKQEKKDDKIKEEEATKTRSKAKDDTVRNKGASEGRETRTPSREADKKTVSKQRRLTEEELKKRGRKRKEYETEKSRADEQLTDIAPSYKGPVECGDKLKVYYGPTHESKVTYEAKVIEIEKEGPEPMYLVHYTGWNNRYDEWIKASRIAQNITQAQGRVKRIKATPRPQTPSTNSANKLKGICNSSTNASQSRRRAQSVAPSTSTVQSASTSTKEAKKEEKDKETIQPTRSTTPLSIASSSSRTKSPATPANRPTRTTRNAELSGIEHRRRTRRTSGHTDISVASESEDSEGYESDTTEPEQTKTRLRGMEERKRKEARRAEERIRTDDVTISDAEDDKDNLDEPRKGRRLRRTPGKSQGIKSEPDSDQEEQPKGRDFDLNQIRSELKGFDKAVKLEMVRSMEPEDEVKLDEKENVSAITASPKLEKTIESPKVEVVETKVESTEDIYEFKEPEPFEFEVRNKRDTNGDKDKLKKRMFEDETKSPKKKQKTPVAGLVKEMKSEPLENDSRKKPRKLFGKRSDDTHEAVTTASGKPSQIASSMSCENVFNKLCESSTSSFNQLKSTIAEESNNKVTGLSLLFNDLPADDEGTRDDSEDRLIISETEISETEQENVFTYQQEIQFQSGKSPDTTESSKNETNTTVESVKEETPIINMNSSNKSANIPDQKQNQVKSLPSQVATGQSPELKMLDSKLLDIVSVPSPIVTPPAPISARLPATSTIEEKLSAAYRSKTKDIKKTPDEETPDLRVTKTIKEASKKLDAAFLQRSKDADCVIPAAEMDKKREQEKIANEENVHREIMRVKRKEEELSKPKKEVELKKFSEAKVVTEHKTKLQDITRDENWRNAGYEMADKKPEEEYKTTDQKEKDRIENRKKQINQDIIDSTDSSDSEQRLVIDNEEPQDVKVPTSTFDAKLQAELDRIENTQERYARSQVLKTSQSGHQQQQEQDCTEFKADVISVLKTDEEGETMNSLLCEEEIPGSPTPLSESTEQTNVSPSCSPPKNEVTENSIVLMEMPFASAPTSGQSTTSSSTVALSMALPKTVEASMPVSLPTQQNASLNLRQSQQQQHHQHQHQYMSALMPPQRRESNEAAPVMDNTPPTTPDSSISNISDSPREERTGGSSPISEDIKLNRDNSEADNDSPGKGPGFNEDDALPNSESNSADRILKPPAKRTVEDMQSPKKRKRNRKHSECGNSGGSVSVGVGMGVDVSVSVDIGVGIGGSNNGSSSSSSGGTGGGGNGSGNDSGNGSGSGSGGNSGSGGGTISKKPGRQNGRHGRYGAGSDSDDTSEGSNLCGINNTPTNHASAITNVPDLSTYSSRSPRPTKYNFYVELGMLNNIYFFVCIFVC